MNINNVLNNLEQATKVERAAIQELCIGRLLRMGSRPTQDGDVESYDEIKAIIMECHAIDNPTLIC
jgi:hypothetical protein